MDQLMALSGNKDVLKQLMKEDSPEACYEILKQNGYEGSYENLVDQAGKVRSCYEKYQSGVLTEEDMDGLLNDSEFEPIVGCPAIFLFIPIAI